MYGWMSLWLMYAPSKILQNWVISLVRGLTGWCSVWCLWRMAENHCNFDISRSDLALINQSRFQCFPGFRRSSHNQFIVLQFLFSSSHNCVYLALYGTRERERSMTKLSNAYRHRWVSERVFCTVKITSHLSFIKVWLAGATRVIM